jgi:hypothetical protein
VTLNEWRTQSDEGVQRVLHQLENARKEMALLCLDWPTEKVVRRDSYVAGLVDKGGADIVACIVDMGHMRATLMYNSMREMTDHALDVRRAVGRVLRHWTDEDIKGVRRQPHMWGLDTEILDNIDKGEL